MNKTIKHKYMDREVIIYYNSLKEIICYVLNSFTPNTKRILFSTPTTNRLDAKRFLNLN